MKSQKDRIIIVKDINQRNSIGYWFILLSLFSGLSSCFSPSSTTPKALSEEVTPLSVQPVFETFSFQLDSSPVIPPIDTPILSEKKTGAIFDDVDFSTNDYCLLGIRSKEVGPNTLADSLGSFYTDDVAILNKFKKQWRFSEETGNYACGYHYRIFLCQKGLSKKMIRVNLNCKNIVFEGQHFEFDPALLSVFYGKLKVPNRSSNTSFKNNVAATNYVHKILKDSMLIMAPAPSGMKYEGYFEFKVPCSYQVRDSDAKEARLLRNIETLVSKKYPKEGFTLDIKGSSPDAIIVKMECNQSLFSQFNLFQIRGHWELHDFYINTYWKE